MNGLKYKKKTKNKKPALLRWNPVFSGSEAYMLVLDTFLFIYLFSSRGSGQTTEQDRERD